MYKVQVAEILQVEHDCATAHLHTKVMVKMTNMRIVPPLTTARIIPTVSLEVTSVEFESIGPVRRIETANKIILLLSIAQLHVCRDFSVAPVDMK